MQPWIRRLAVATTLLLAGLALPAAAQVTTSSIRGTVKDSAGVAVANARVSAIHQPSGTRYEATSRPDGAFTMPGVRVGGPYLVTATAIGYEKQVRENVMLNLGVAADIHFVMRQVEIMLDEMTVTGGAEAISSTRTGAATTVAPEALKVLPTITRQLSDFTRLTPQASGLSIAGQDPRLNNITVDGSYFNNSFGLDNVPGARTGVSPISLDAIEQVQVNIAPYDVRQGNFVGAAVNTVTKSGTNEFSGSMYYMTRNQDFTGTEAKGIPFNPGTFDYDLIGVRLGGPIVRNKLFFFGSYEDDKLGQPGTTFLANPGGQPVQGNTTRVLQSDLSQLSQYLQNNFGYNTGGWQDYNFSTPALRILGKVDFNLNDNNKFSVRYTHLNSDTDILVSNSSSLGFGNRRTRLEALNFQNSNYVIKENIRSIVGEWNSVIGTNKSNNLILGYTYQDESRDTRGAAFFPFVDILRDGITYTSFGYEPFTPNNELRYKTFQLQNNFTIYGNKHDLTFGASLERYQSENVFFPGSQSVYTYNSLQDFYTDANDFLANPNRTTSPVTLRRFQVRWSNQPGLAKPVQPLKVWYAGLYAQDEFRGIKNLKLTLGLRVDVPKFDSTAFVNPEVDTFTFRDENGQPVKYSTSKLPDANPLFSPRLGFNLDVAGKGNTQVRGGTGIFTGRPAYVWISNQVGNNGVLTGFEQLDNTRARPWNPNPDRYKPTNVTGAPAASYELAFSDPGFRFPQLWRSNLAVDQKLPWGLIATGEFIYNKDVNGIAYINANLAAPNAKFTGADQRPRWTASNRVVSKVTSAVVLENQDVGKSWNAAVSLERSFRSGFYAKAAYSYGESKGLVDPGSIAFGSWNNNPHAGDPNNPGLGYTFNSPGHRVFATVSYQKDWFKFGGTMVSIYWERRTQGNGSYAFSGDLNGDGGTQNDLIYIPRDKSEMNFETFTSSGRTFTATEQADAWEAFIQQDKYLRENRGKYAERGAIFLPMVARADFAIAQDFFTRIGGKQNRLQVRLDIFNVGNLLNSDWGVGQRQVTTTPLIARGADSQGRALYRLRNIGTDLLKSSFEQTTGFADVYRMQLGVRYIFN